MKTILTLVVLAATFLFGYDVGRAPDSTDRPDIVGWLKVKSTQIYQAGKKVIASVSDDSENPADSGDSSDSY